MAGSSQPVAAGAEHDALDAELGVARGAARGVGSPHAVSTIGIGARPASVDRRAEPGRRAWRRRRARCPSASTGRPTRRRAAVPSRPAMPPTIGGCGVCSGFGSAHTASKSNQRPWCCGLVVAPERLAARRRTRPAPGSAPTRGCRAGGRRAARRSSRRPRRSRTARPTGGRGWRPSWRARTRRARAGGPRPVPTRSVVVAWAAASRLRNGSIIRRYGRRQLAAGGVGRAARGGDVGVLADPERREAAVLEGAAEVVRGRRPRGCSWW